MWYVSNGKRVVKSHDIQFPDDKVIKYLQQFESYKYLGILKADKVL